MTAVEEQPFSIPDVDIKFTFDIPKTYCPFIQEICIGEVCKFWWGDGCIITKSLLKVYQSGVLGRD